MKNKIVTGIVIGAFIGCGVKAVQIVKLRKLEKEKELQEIDELFEEEK